MDKTYLTQVDGIYDLLSDSIEFINNSPIDSFKVTKDYIARPDKISLIYYNTDEYWWAILRANNLGYGFRASLSFRRKITQQFDEDIISAICYNKILIIPSLSDISDHLNKIKGF